MSDQDRVEYIVEALPSEQQAVVLGYLAALREELEKAKQDANLLRRESQEVQACLTDDECPTWDDPCSVQVEDAMALRKDRDRLREELAQAQALLEDSRSAMNEHMQIHAKVVNELKQVKHDYAQLQEAYNAKAAGVPLGPIVGAQTIVNQQLYINKLEARIADLEGQP